MVNLVLTVYSMPMVIKLFMVRILTSALLQGSRFALSTFR